MSTHPCVPRSFPKKTRALRCFRKSLGPSQESSPTLVSGNYLPRGFSPRFFSNFPPQPYTHSAWHRNAAMTQLIDFTKLSNECQRICGVFFRKKQNFSAFLGDFSVDFPLSRKNFQYIVIRDAPRARSTPARPSWEDLPSCPRRAPKDGRRSPPFLRRGAPRPA